MITDTTATEDPLGSLRVGIVGLGLMGGSLALALRGRVAGLIGVERQGDTRQMALREGVVDVALEQLTPDAPPIDLLVLATPVRVIQMCIRDRIQNAPMNPVTDQVILGTRKIHLSAASFRT